MHKASSKIPVIMQRKGDIIFSIIVKRPNSKPFQSDIMDRCTEIMLIRHTKFATHNVDDMHLSFQNEKAHTPLDLEQVTCYFVVASTSVT